MTLRDQGIYFLFIFAFYIFQNLILFPLENSFRTDNFADIASMVYLPHGMKILYGIILGPISFIYILAAQFLSGVMFLGFDETVFIGSIFGSVAIVVPVMLLNASSNKPVLSAPADYMNTQLSIIWTYMSLAIFTSLLSVYLHDFLYGPARQEIHIFMFAGDIVGALTILALFLFIYRPLMNRIILGKHN